MTDTMAWVALTVLAALFVAYTVALWRGRAAQEHRLLCACGCYGGRRDPRCHGGNCTRCCTIYCGDRCAKAERLQGFDGGKMLKGPWGGGAA